MLQTRVFTFTFNKKEQTFFNHKDTGLFQKEEVGQLGNVLMVGNAVIPEDIAEVPEFGDDLLCGHAARPPSSYR